MHVFMPLKRISTPQKWFLAAAVLLVLFIVYTVVVSTGVLLYSTLYQEQWLLHRPLNRFDCVLLEWKQFGEIGYSLFFTLLLGIACLCLKYRYRMLPYLFLLLLLGIGLEYVGKHQFPQPVPDKLRSGLNSLSCPQLSDAHRSTKILVALGAWWQAPPVRSGRVKKEQSSTLIPIVIDEDASNIYGYPSGHAMRWCFIGLVTCWLAWRHVKYRIPRALLMVIALVIAFGGGFAQFYIGLHLPTDLVAGYLMGAGSACCAIGLLVGNGTRC